VLVCPQCRKENEEDAKFCSSCGRSLAPGPAAFARPRERAEEEDTFEIPKPRTTSPWVAVAVLGLVVLGGVAATLYATSRPDPCRGKYASVFYSYCTTVPKGWVAAPQFDPAAPNGRVDVFIGGAQGPTMFVRAQTVAPNTTTELYTQIFYSVQQDAQVGPLEQTAVGGQPALAWTLQVQEEDGGSVRQREVALVRAGVGWRITLRTEAPSQQPPGPSPAPAVSMPPNFTNAVIDMETTLQSWVWR
jgi:hypothetical protein